jgi:hypothetical protein
MTKKKYYGYNSFIELTEAIQIGAYKKIQEIKDEKKRIILSKFWTISEALKEIPLKDRVQFILKLIQKEKLDLQKNKILEHKFLIDINIRTIDILQEFQSNHPAIEYVKPISLNSKQKYYHFNGNEKQLKAIYNFLNTTKFGKYFFIEDTSYNVFSKALSGEKFTTKINWRDSQLTLKYLIKIMYRYQLIDEGKVSWVKSENTFLHNGNKIDSINLSKSKNPELVISNKIDSFFSTNFDSKK